MPTFSDLPDELVLITWGFVDEPEDIESFALVSKRIYRLSTPFVQGHARMKTSDPTIIIDLEEEPSGPYDLLERYLHNPRLAFYIHGALIDDYRRDESQRNVSLASLSPERIAEFESAVRCSFYVPPSEKDDWVREIKGGDPDPIVALIVMRLTKLRYLRLVYPYTGGNDYLLETLKRMTLSPDGASNLGSSVTQIEPDGGSQVIFRKRSPFLKINKIEMNLGEIELKVLSKLLRGIENLKSFAFTPTSGTTLAFRELKDELLKCSRSSLNKLVLHDDSESQRYMGHLTGFQNLVEVSISACLLLGREDEQTMRLADALPASIQKLNLYLGDAAEPDEVEDVIDQVLECKMGRCPSLVTFWIEMVDPVEMDDEEEIQLKEKCAEVGIKFEMGEYSNL